MCPYGTDATYSEVNSDQFDIDVIPGGGAQDTDESDDTDVLGDNGLPLGPGTMISISPNPDHTKPVFAVMDIKITVENATVVYVTYYGPDGTPIGSPVVVSPSVTHL